jgi:hypothetical protein
MAIEVIMVCVVFVYTPLSLLSYRRKNETDVIPAKIKHKLSPSRVCTTAFLICSILEARLERRIRPIFFYVCLNK